MIPRIIKTPQKSFFLLGPRGSGKTTWLRHTFPEARFINLLSEELYQRLLARPGLFADELRVLKPGDRVIVDEIQRLPNLLNEVHRLIEERGLQFVLCGSSAWKLKRAGVNLLAGRVLRRFMHPFIPEELGEEFDLEKALRFGLLPLVWDSEEKEETLAAYTQLYLKEEVQAEALVRNLPGFARFLPLAALFNGRVINTTTIAREAGVARTTVTGFLEILEETLLCFRLPAFEARLRVRERRLPKWYWCDPGLVRAMKGRTGPTAPEERGPLFEGLIAQLLRAYRDYTGLFDEIYYWAPLRKSEIEVDFLLVRKNETIALEIKSGSNFQDQWCKGLRAVAELSGLRRRLLVYNGEVALRTVDGIEVLPFLEFTNLLANQTL
jgi:predicted AAA+ superfamily ATPase